MIRIALDLELEQPNTNPQTPDSWTDVERIIQVGYCVFNDQTGEFLRERLFHVYYEDPLSEFIQKLTGITNEDVRDGFDIEYVLDFLNKDRETFQASRKLLTWGGGDQPALMRENLFPQDWAFGRSAFNVKHLYQLYEEQTGGNPSGGLKKCCNRLGIKRSGRAHNALVDAKDTASLFMEILKRTEYKRS